MMIFKSLSPKQQIVMNWWCDKSPYSSRDAIICDGAVRSGKTICMSFSFVMWACAHFNGGNFAMCAKTLRSLRRNVVDPAVNVLREIGYHCDVKSSRDYVDVSFDGGRNRFYLFGGSDEASAGRIQGITLSGILLDEVALMPRSFVEQALARCSVSGSKFWFNCNPENPYHWFYTEWIKKTEQKNALYLHFLMDDNPSLTKKILKRYQSLYSGTFYERFVLGKWVSAQGLVYPMFSYDEHVFRRQKIYSKYYISCDYGTVNPTSMGLWGENDGIWYRLKEFYYDSKLENKLKTDEEYYHQLVKLAGDRKIQSVIVDPSASSFIECIRRHAKFNVVPAKNDVIDGIRRVGDELAAKRLRFHVDCKDVIREFNLYVWDDKRENDAPRKKDDHSMDDVRYFVNTVLTHDSDDFFVVSAARG